MSLYSKYYSRRSIFETDRDRDLISTLWYYARLGLLLSLDSSYIEIFLVEYSIHFVGCLIYLLASLSMEQKCHNRQIGEFVTVIPHFYSRSDL
jgi:hypothetical protein